MQSAGAQHAAALTAIARLLAAPASRSKPLDVNRFITNIVEFIQRTLGEGIEVEAVGAAGLWPVDIDHAQLETTIVNLAISARDAMPPAESIEALTPLLHSDYCRNNHEVTPGQ